MINAHIKGGREAQKWRRQVALLHDREKKKRAKPIVQTYKFQTETDIGQIPDDVAKSAELLSGIVSGYEKGSLTGVLLAIHLSGFQLFSSAEKTKSFLTEWPDDKFTEVLEKNFNSVPKDFKPSKFFIFITSNPRKQDDQWKLEHITSHVSYKLGLPKRDNGQEDEYHSLRVISKDFAEWLFDEFHEWKGVNDNSQKCLQWLEDRMSEDFPDLPEFASIRPPPLIPEKRTFAFSQNPKFYDMTTIDKAIDKAYWPHLAVQIIANRLISEGQIPEEKAINKEISSESDNALSWLFGKGLEWLQSKKIDELVDALGASSQQQCNAVKQLKCFADAVPPSDPLWVKKYGDFRRQIASRLQSWITNYWRRLASLKTLENKFSGEEKDYLSLHGDLFSREGDIPDLFSGNKLDARELKEAFDSLPSKMGSMTRALEILSGSEEIKDTDEFKSKIDDVSEIADLMSDLTGEANILINRLQQEAARDDNPIENIKDIAEHTKLNVPKNAPDKVNEWAQPKIDIEVQQSLLTKFTDLQKARQQHYNQLSTWLIKNAQDIDYLAPLRSEEKTKNNRTGKEADEFARRQVINHLAHRVRDMSPDTLHKISPAFEDAVVKRKDARKFFYNRQGSFYRSPYSKSKHQAYPLSEAGLARDWLEFAERELQCLKRTQPDRVSDICHLENFCFSSRLRCLPENDIPHDLAKPFLEAHEKEIISLNGLWLNQLKAGQRIDRPSFLKMFNLYQSAMNGLVSQMERRSVITRCVFNRTGDDKLVYVPRNKGWSPPKAYLRGDSAIAKALGKKWIARYDDTGLIDAKSSIKKYAKTHSNLSEPFKAFLVQAPHSWCFPLGIEGLGKDAEATLTFSFKGEIKLTNLGKAKSGLVQLKGPSSWMNRLDQAIMGNKQHGVIKVGCPNLIFDTQHDQNPDKTYSRKETQLILATPFTDERQQAHKGESIWDYMVAIDQGERGIGYAVFDVKKFITNGTLEPIDKGTVAIKGIRDLIRAVHNHRKRRQPLQKVSQNYSNQLQQRRQTVIGQVCYEIERLMREYSAFPVLESNVKNFESGSGQLPMIYKSVSAMYLWDEVEARKNLRTHHWQGRGQWIHPYLMKNSFEGKESKTAHFPN